MASKFFNSIKSAFVTEVEEQQEVQQPLPVQSSVQTTVAVPSVRITPNIEGQIDEDLLQKLCQKMEDSNLPGPDYLELKNVANNDDMKRAIPDESQRLMVAFITMKSSSPEMTKERIVTSIDEYVKMMETERSIGHEQLNAIWNEEVEAKKTLISEAEARIAELQKELQEKVQFVQTMNGEIATSSNKCTTNRVNFDHTVDFIVKSLNDDKSKLSIILN